METPNTILTDISLDRPLAIAMTTQCTSDKAIEHFPANPGTYKIADLVNNTEYQDAKNLVVLHDKYNKHKGKVCSCGKVRYQRYYGSDDTNNHRYPIEQEHGTDLTNQRQYLYLTIMFAEKMLAMPFKEFFTDYQNGDDYINDTMLYLRCHNIIIEELSLLAFEGIKKEKISYRYACAYCMPFTKLVANKLFKRSKEDYKEYLSFHGQTVDKAKIAGWDDWERWDAVMKGACIDDDLACKQITNYPGEVITYFKDRPEMITQAIHQNIDEFGGYCHDLELLSLYQYADSIDKLMLKKEYKKKSATRILFDKYLEPRTIISVDGLKDYCKTDIGKQLASVAWLPKGDERYRRIREMYLGRTSEAYFVAWSMAEADTLEEFLKVYRRLRW